MAVRTVGRMEVMSAVRMAVLTVESSEYLLVGPRVDCLAVRKAACWVERWVVHSENLKAGKLVRCSVGLKVDLKVYLMVEKLVDRLADNSVEWMVEMRVS